MQKSAQVPLYRIKGLPPPFLKEPKADDSLRFLLKCEPAALLDRVVRSLPRPHLSDLIYDYKALEKLAALWPTFKYLSPKPNTGRLKTLPITLAEHIPQDLLGEDDTGYEIIAARENQEREKSAISLLISSREQGYEPEILTDCPHAMGFACQLYAGSPWLTKNRETIENIVKQSPTASFIALSSGAFAGAGKALWNSMALDPGLVLEMGRSPARGQRPDEWYGQILSKSALHYAVWRHLTGSTNIADSILDQFSKRDSLVAGVCLGLQPHHPDARIWRKVAWRSNEAIYWSGRIWKSGDRDIAEFPFSAQACTQLVKDPRWYYHWLQDCETDEINNKVALIWPSPWSVEFIADRGLPADLVFNLCSKQELDPEDAMESAVILWAADYTSQEI